MNVLVKVVVAAAAAGVTVLAAAGCAASGASSRPAPAKGSVQACIAFGVRAIDEHRTVTQVPAACRGLSRAEVNFALGRAIYLVAGTGHHKVAWRHDAAVAGTRLARLITAAMAQSPGGSSAGAAASGAGRTGPVDRRPLAVATLLAWLLTMAAGGYMLLRFVLGGGLRRQLAAGDRTSPAVVLTHFGLASAGLLLWALYLATSWLAVAWVAVALLLPVFGFGMATLIVWTSGTSRRSSGTSRVPPGTSAEPPGTSGTPPGTSAEPAGTSGTPPGTSAEPAGTSETPDAPPATSGPVPGTSGAPPSTSPAGAPGHVQVAEVADQASSAEAPATAAAGRPPSRWLTVIIPIGHGLLAATTILLALLTALGAT
jgi:manganese efflux pump family protein